MIPIVPTWLPSLGFLSSAGIKIEGYFLVLPLVFGLTLGGDGAFLGGYGTLAVMVSTFDSGLTASFALLVLTYYFF